MNSAVKYTTCKAQVSATYAGTLSQQCAGRGTISGGGNAIFIDAAVSYDSYSQCKDAAVAKRNNQLNVCAVFEANRLAKCP